MPRSTRGRLRAVGTDMALPVVVLGCLSAPMLFTSRSFAADWTNHLWLVWQQSLNLEQLGHPSYFVQSSIGAFFPWYAFYGGTLYTAAGAAAAPFGSHPIPAFVAAHVIAAAMAYAGWLWLARQFELGGWRAHVPAVLFVTSSYYVSNYYQRSDFPEVVAVSSIPLVAAAGLHLLRAERWKAAPMAAFTLGVVFFTGSHPHTLVWGLTFLGAGAAVLAFTLRPGWLPSRRRAAALLGVGAAAALVNAWVLLPAAAYGGRLRVRELTEVITYEELTAPSQVFSPLRTGFWEQGQAPFDAQAPVLAIAWAVMVALVLRRRGDRVTWKGVLALCALMAPLLFLLIRPGTILSLPGPWSFLQYPYRLVTYVTLAGVGMVLMAMIGAGRAPGPVRRVADVSIVAIALLSVGLAIDQAWTAKSGLSSRDEALRTPVDPPRSWYIERDYADRSAPVVRPSVTSFEGGSPLARRTRVDLPVRPGRDRYSYRIRLERSGTVKTNVLGGPYVVRVAGATPVGRTREGFMVVAVKGTPRPRNITFATARSTPLRAGVLVSLAAIILSLGLIGAVALAGRR